MTAALTPAQGLPVGARPTVRCPHVMWQVTGLDVAGATAVVDGAPEAASPEAAAVAWARTRMCLSTTVAIVRVTRTDDPKEVVWRRVVASRTFGVGITGEPAGAAS